MGGGGVGRVGGRGPGGEGFAFACPTYNPLSRSSFADAEPLAAPVRSKPVTCSSAAMCDSLSSSRALLSSLLYLGGGRVRVGALADDDDDDSGGGHPLSSG